jgi:hypothetical protein
MDKSIIVREACTSHPLTPLALGQAALHAALVTPLGLSVHPNGEWAFFQFIALPGHPNPGNAKHGYSHPSSLQAFDKSRGRRGPDRYNLPLEPLPTKQTDVLAWAIRTCAWLWPGCSVRIEVARHVSPCCAGVTAYNERGELIQYGDADADSYDLNEVVLLRKLNRVDLATIAATGQPAQTLQRAYKGGSCWEDYPALESPESKLLEKLL